MGHKTAPPQRTCKPITWSRLRSFFKKWAGRISKSIEFTWSVLVGVVRVGAILLVLAAAIYSYRELTRATLVIGPINVPKQYAEAGITADVMGSRVADALTGIEVSANTTIKRDRLVLQSDEISAPDVELPGMKLGLKTIVEIVHTIFPFSKSPGASAAR